MYKNPLLSVIVPVYNVEDYLTKCLDSLLAQNFSDYEIILVDDGSTDNSGIICDKYAAANSVFQCIHKPNGGLPSARKSGFRASHGQYVTFVDSDDWISPDMYHTMCQTIYDTHADIVICDYTAVMPGKEINCSSIFPSGFYDKKRLEKDVYPYMIYSGSFFKYGTAPSLCNKLFRRDLLQQHLFHVPDDIVVGEDALASYSCMLEASSIYFINESFYYYRSNANSVSRRAISVERLLENHKVFDTFYNVIDTLTYPYMSKQLDYYCVYQSLLTFEAVFKNMVHMPSDFKQTFIRECLYPPIREAFSHVPVKDITGLHNKLYALCIRHKLCGLFRLLLQH